MLACPIIMLTSIAFYRTSFLQTSVGFIAVEVGGRQQALKTSQEAVILKACKRGPCDSVSARKEQHLEWAEQQHCCKQHC